MGISKFIAVLLILYLSYKIITIVVLPVAVRLTMNRFRNRFYEQNPHLRPQEKTQEGKVTIHRVSEDTSTKVPSDLGEYTDYEEIN